MQRNAKEMGGHNPEKDIGQDQDGKGRNKVLSYLKLTKQEPERIGHIIIFEGPAYQAIA